MGTGKKWGGGSCIAAWFVLAELCWVGGEGVKLGVLLDPNSTVGKLCNTSIQLALSDLYTANPQYKTRIIPLFKNAGDIVGVASAAWELLREGVDVIMGAQTSEKAIYLAEFGGKYEIPIISLTATSPSLSPKQNPYLIRAVQSDSAQVGAISAIVQLYGWREIVLIYEDTEYGRGIIPDLADALQENGTRLIERTGIPWRGSGREIGEELRRVKNLRLRMRVFLLHMSASLGRRVLIEAKEEGMMSDGYAWIVTDGLSSLLHPITDPQALDAMQGIVGVRPYIPNTQKLHQFQATFNQQLPFPLVQAYDTMWALGTAVEKLNATISATATATATATDRRAMRVSLRDAIRNTKIEGISGVFILVDGELNPPTFEVFNLVGEKERIIGYWSQKGGRGVRPEVAISNSKNQLKQPIWPGPTAKQPKMKLRIGIPSKGFPEFVNADTKEPQNSSGFCIDVFRLASGKCNCIDYEFVPFVNQIGKSNGSYDELLRQIEAQKVDAIVGDITIVASRSEFVDFTLPYSASGVSMLVSATSDKKEHMWIFMKPFTWDLWLLSFFSFMFTGFVVWLLECRVNTDFGRGPAQQQIGLIFWFSFSTLVFAHRERILNNLSRFLMIIWVFVVLILTQSYTANLSSMLTVQRLHPSFVDVKEIREKGYFVGFQNGSFVRDFLITRFGFDETKLIPCGSSDEFKLALNRGTFNGGVAAIFDEIPYIKVFLRKYSSGYQMVGPIYSTGGFGFAFPKGSPLVADFSRAILNVTEDQDKMRPIEQKYFSNQEPPKPEPNDSALDVYRFGGLFIITAVATWSSLLIYLAQFLITRWPDSASVQSPLTSKFVEMGKLFCQEHFHSSSPRTRQSRVHSVPETAEETTTPQTVPDHNVDSMNTVAN
ncbi:Glutamate receptor 2.7, partial [Cucurbita argyrosperma subsp. argyrosperma]